MKPITLAITASLAMFMAASAVPRLIVSTPSLAPESKIDLALDLPVIEVAEIGKTIPNTWLEIQPALPGKLRWKAQNIAAFLPEQPPAIGVSYAFSIPKDRKHLDGSPVAAGKFATLSCEEFRIVSSHSPKRWSADYTPSLSSWLLAFNDDVDPAAAAAFIAFASKSGQRVAARLERVSAAKAGYLGSQNPTWTARWAARDADAASEAEILPDSLLPHVLGASPLSPLPPGEAWHLSVLKGLPNASASARLGADTQFQIGNIETFRVTEISTRVIADEPRRIILTFNHPLPEMLPEDFLETAISIVPQPENLKAEVDGRRIILTGDLLAEDQYTVTLHPKLSSITGFPLSGGKSEKLKFEHLKPGVALPSEDVGQLAKGNRKYRLFTQNLESMRVRIKKLEGADLIRAFQGYRHFTGRGPDHESIRPTAPVPYPLIVGSSVADREIPLGNPIDTTRIVTLDWNEVLPKDMTCGVLFLESSGKPHAKCGTSDRSTTQAIIQLTDIGLAWKLTPAEAFVYAFSCETGAPLPGVNLQLFGEDASALQSADTDASGLATLPRLAAARHLQASLEKDTYVTAFDGTLETVGMWHFPVRYSWNKPLDSSRQAFLFTDRSLYRPGETVRLKGILRTLAGNAILPAKPGPARIVLLDPTDREILNQAVTLSAGGSFDFTHALAPARTGTHTIRLEFPEELAAVSESNEHVDWYERERILENARFDIPLRVEEFRRNAFEITQEISTPEIGAKSVSVNLGANYYQGQPVAAGEVKTFSSVTARNPYPERFRDFQFGNHRTYDWSYWYHYFGYGDDDEDRTRHSTRLQGEARLTADGSATFAVRIPDGDFPTSREVMVASEVTDANNQTLTARGTTIVHPASVHVGISRIDRIVRVGEQMPLRIVAIDTADQPYTAPLKLTATLTRELNSAVKTRNESGDTTTRNDVSEHTVLTTEITLDPAASAGGGQPFVFTPESNGLHFLTLRGTDPQGRPFATVTRIHVYGGAEYPWQYEDGLRVKLVAEKKSYLPGETARVLVLSPIEGTALVTVEREKVLRSFLVPLTADNPVIEIPLSDADAPNAYVSVLIVKGARDSAREFKQPQLRLGYCELLVNNRADLLNVAIDTPDESCRPGEIVTLTGCVKLANGQPAAAAEVTLYAEDEGTLAVMGYQTPRPMDYFYRPRILGVEAGASFQSFIAEDPEMQTFNNKGFFVGGGGDLARLADLLRRNFDPCATWAPALATDAAGKFSHSFKLPDTLTRYRLIAIAHHETTRFGHAEAAISAKKDLMLEPKAPRFAHQSDTLHPQVLVRNASLHAGTWQIAFNAHAAEGTPVCRALGPVTEIVSLAPGASATLVFPTIAENTGEAVLTWNATPVSLQKGNLTDELARRLSDAVEQRFEVVYPMPLLRQVKSLKLGTPGETHDLIKLLDPRLLAANGRLDLEFARSPLIEAAASIDYLLQYPYGCVEQTTSSLIPWCSVIQLKGIIPSFANISEQQAANAIQAGADRLLGMQLKDGSFTYWPGGTDTVDWATPYAGLGLILASNAGARVPAAAIDTLAQYLIRSLRGIGETKSPYALESHARALMVLSLAGRPQPACHSTMIDRLAHLSSAARAMLATAIAHADPADPRNLAAARAVLVSKTPFTSKFDGWMPWSPDHALHLIAWLAIDPDAAETTAALDHMLNERNPYGHWRNTWVNGWSLIAMGLYAENEDSDSAAITLRLDGNDGLESLQLTADAPTTTRSFPLAPRMKLTLSADHRAFVRLSLASKPPVAPRQPVSNNGLAIDRIHQRVLPDGGTELLTEPRVGDLIRVSLRVTLPGDDTKYLVIEDPLPAIFETVNSDFKSQSSALGALTSENDWNVSHSELRAGRAVFFLDDIHRKGTYTLTYLARCTLAGLATAPPARIESMYHPENFALSASRTFDSR
ncbi:MAG: MG2 domain-containing protein [Luteolibacter sp.]|jgi:uncharacterized protein YfaS (alpha-2-macroglobulin family)|nr:MG2 domain-containing protein [Luteolibacter sp.]